MRDMQYYAIMYFCQLHNKSNMPKKLIKIYRVSEKSPTPLWEVIRNPKTSKKVHINIGLEMSRFQVIATFMFKNRNLESAWHPSFLIIS